MKDVRPRTQGPEPSATRLAPRAFCTGLVRSLGEGFVWGGYLYSRSNFKLNCAAVIVEWRQLLSA
jgi:hypothetical protein